MTYSQWWRRRGLACLHKRVVGLHILFIEGYASKRSWIEIGLDSAVSACVCRFFFSSTSFLNILFPLGNKLATAHWPENESNEVEQHRFEDWGRLPSIYMHHSSLPSSIYVDTSNKASWSSHNGNVALYGAARRICREFSSYSHSCSVH